MGKRGKIQALSALLSNPHLSGFLKGKIATGGGKRFCVPGLNCYSCPGAAGACPVGSFQAVVGASSFSFSYYVTGILILFGVLTGRLICGFFCPFGWFQDLLYRLPVKKRELGKMRALRYVKYGVMILVVWLAGVLLTDGTGLASPYFCKYLCPQGVLEGALPLAAANVAIRRTLGKLFAWKFFLLIALAGTSASIYRPFCKWLCPLGAFYSLFNRVSFYRYRLERESCVKCGRCTAACKMDVDVLRQPNAAECIRCGACVEACPTGALRAVFEKGRKQGESRAQKCSAAGGKKASSRSSAAAGRERAAPGICSAFVGRKAEMGSGAAAGGKSCVR